MTRYRRRQRIQTTRPLVGFLLVASFGILFAGCGPKEQAPETEEFTFTATDAERIEELLQESEEGEEDTSEDIRLEVGDPNPEDIPVLDLSAAETYDAIRTGPSAAGDDVYRITNAYLNVRSAPKVTAEQIDRLERGDTVTLIDFVSAAWAHIALSNGREGYVSNRYIAKLTSEEQLSEAKEAFKDQYFVDFGFLNVRKEPDSQSEKIGELAGQSFVEMLSKDDVWARVPYGEGEGYVAVEYLSPFLPNFLVRQDRFNLPILQYRLAGGSDVLSSITSHVTALRNAGWKVLTLKDFYELLMEQEERDVRLQPQSVVIAVSDITADNVTELSETLLSMGQQATLFIQTKGVGLSGITEKMFLTLLANGHDIQSGAHMGDDLRSLTNAQVELELSQSRSLLEERTGRPVYAVSYPRGGVNDRVARLAVEAGYLLGLSNAPDTSFERRQLLRLPSIEVVGEMSSEELLEEISDQ